MNQDELELLLEARQLVEDSVSVDGDQLICECECISLNEIRGFTKGRSVSLKELKHRFNLGAGCSSCVKAYSDWKVKI